jgi:hypothetical protein
MSVPGAPWQAAQFDPPANSSTCEWTADSDPGEGFCNSTKTKPAIKDAVASAIVAEAMVALD